MLPDAEALVRSLAEQMRGKVSADAGLVGIYSGGAWVAERLHRALGLTVPLGLLAVTLHRDDFGRIGLHRESRRSQIPFSVDDREVILVDDVLFTGRTVRAAIEALFDYGRPARVQLAVLADRGHRELPIRPDYVGKNIPTSRRESVAVMLSEHDRVDRVVILVEET